MTEPRSRRRASVSVAAFTDADAADLAGFIRQVWDPGATAESVLEGRRRLAARIVDGGTHIPTVLLRVDGAVVGHLTSLPERVAFGGRQRPISWLVGFHVLPEYRNGPVGVLIAKEMLRIAPHSMCSMVLDAPLRIYTALGWRHLGTVPDLVCVLDGAAVAKRVDPRRFGALAKGARLLDAARRTGLAPLGGGAASALARWWASTAPRATGLEFVVGDAAAFSAVRDADALWERCAHAIPASVVRDGHRVRHRFGDAPGRYVVVEAWARSRLAGWAVVRRPRAEGDERLGGVRVAPIADLMFDPARPALAAALVHAAVDTVRREGMAEAVIASSPDRRLRAVLQRAAFVPAGATLHLVAHPSVLPDPAPAFDAWWHARGDGDADQSF